MRSIIINIFLLVITCSSCSVGKYLPRGETLYRGARVEIEKQPGATISAAKLRKQLLIAALPKGNKFLLGRPYQVWWWYAIGPSKKVGGFRYFFRRLLGDPPVLSSRVNPIVTAQNMTAYLENIGYFHSTVKGAITSKGYLSTAIYTAAISPRHKFQNISWLNDSSALLNALDNKKISILKKGMPYRISDIEAERQQLDKLIKTKGFYFFNPNYIMAYVDSTVGNNRVDLLFSIKNTIPEDAKHIYTINSITVFPNYNLLTPPMDTSNIGLIKEDGLFIRDKFHQYNHRLFKQIITYRPGEVYSSKDQNVTLNRLINLGTFKFVKNTFKVVKDSVDPYKLNVYYYLTSAQKKSLQAGIDGFSNENKYIGSSASLTWKNRNFLKGSELFSFKMYGAMEISFNNVIDNNINFRLGSEAAINFPRYLIPFVKISEKNLYPVRTQLLFGYEYFMRPGLYNKNIFRFNYEFQWRQNPNKQQIFAPIAITYINAPNIRDSFFKAVAIMPSLQSTIYNEIIIGSNYSFTYNTLNPLAASQWFFNATVEAAGNVAGLISGAKTPRSKTIFGSSFSQFIRGDIDLRFTKKYQNSVEWATRLQIGIGIPYNNSNFLPFSKQYVIGGASSIRAYSVRSLGPGSYLPSLNDKNYFQTIGGDYKLLINSEIRLPIKGRFNAAIFTDIGNIWTKDSTLFGKAGQLKKDFLKELAIASGIGLRVDAGLFLLRLDIGIPIRKPYLPDGERLVINKIDLGNGGWRKDNLNFNFAIGYPF